MATTDKAVAILNETLTTLEASIAGRKSEINNAYKEAIGLANKAHKESLALAEKTLKESLTEFSSENAEIAKLKNALKALTGETSKATSEKGKRVDDWFGKFNTVLTKMGKTVADNPKSSDVKKMIDELYPDLGYKTGAYNNAWTTYKSKIK
ncbi:hypothetical protein ACVW0P_004493 [Mucilaginibacter sp. UYNi724]